MDIRLEGGGGNVQGGQQVSASATAAPSQNTKTVSGGSGHTHSQHALSDFNATNVLRLQIEVDLPRLSENSSKAGLLLEDLVISKSCTLSSYDPTICLQHIAYENSFCSVTEKSIGDVIITSSLGEVAPTLTNNEALLDRAF